MQTRKGKRVAGKNVYNSTKPFVKKLKRSKNRKIRRLGFKIKPGQIRRGLTTGIKSAEKIAGKVGAPLTVALITLDILDNGKINPSSIVDATLLTVGIGAGIAIYGAVDLMLDISGKLDETIGEIGLP